MKNKGLFIVFEGIDGSGKTSQINLLHDRLKDENKYQDILTTREPTWRAIDIKKRLGEEKDPMSSGEEMANSYVLDRSQHYEEIKQDLEKQRIVLCDRFTLSTLAYQSTQGVQLKDLIKYHERKGIGAPDLTFYLDVSAEVALERITKRGEKVEKFEDLEFQKLLCKNYRDLIDNVAKDHPSLLGINPIINIDGSRSSQEVSDDIWKAYSKFA